jgi:1-acyl-sn-glycerol-3-phosphate acyltransferase
MRSFAFNLFFYPFTGLVACLAWVTALTRPREALWPILRFWGKTVLGGVRLILGSQVELRGLERIPAEGPHLVVCKHQSELDAVLLASFIPQAGAVAMQELENYPFFGRILRKLGFVLVSLTGDQKGRTQQVVEGALRIKAEGRPMVIFPEATLMSLGARERYRKGVGHMYLAMEVPVVPVASCLGVIWPRREWVKHAGQTAAIEVLDPILPGMALEPFMEEVERRIEEATIRLIREHAKGAVLAAAEDRHARGVANED